MSPEETGSTADEPQCPYCDSTDTVQESEQGTSLCRSIHFCRACDQSFEKIS